MARKYDIEAVLGSDYEFELTPELLAYELSMDFSNQVIKRCTEAGMGLGELASLMGIGASTLSEKLNGQNLTLKSIASMAIALNCDVKAPELILESEVTCTMEPSLSVFLPVVDDDLVPGFDEACPKPEAIRQAETMMEASGKTATNYLLETKFGKVA